MGCDAGAEPKAGTNAREEGGGSVSGRKREGLLCQNNELGFTASDVSALCDLGSSTKSTNLDTIGSKGIGFKSVFMVSDQPWVRSGDFSFMFDTVKHGRLGYLIPEWVEEDEDDDMCTASMRRSGSSRELLGVVGSTLWLPFRAPAAAAWSVCADKFESVEAVCCTCFASWVVVNNAYAQMHVGLMSTAI
jgi:hypothetical protein